MFGFGKSDKSKYVKLTGKEVKKLEKSMSPRELKDFKKRQKDARDDALWREQLIFDDIFDD